MSEGATPLMYACQQGNEKECSDLLNKKPQAARERDRTEKTVLHYCSENINTRCAEAVIRCAPDTINDRDEDGYTPLHLAVIAGNKPFIQLLINSGANINALDNEKHSVVHWATVCGEQEALEMVLRAGASVSCPDVHGGFPLHYAAQMCGPGAELRGDSRAGLAVLRTLLAYNADVDQRDKDGRQPILWAASAGSAEAILALVKAGAKVEASDKDGLTALHCAASRGHTDCLETLVALCGAHVDTIDMNGCTALFYAVTLGHADATQLLLSLGAEPNRQDRKGRTPAHCGASKGQLETLRILLSGGANLWLRNVKGDVPLHEAAASGRRELVTWLLNQRPEAVNVANNDGKCSLHVAAINNYLDVCKVLLDAGSLVNPVLRSHKGEMLTPLDAALLRGHRSTAKFLQMHGGVPRTKLTEASASLRGSMINRETVYSDLMARMTTSGFDMYPIQQSAQLNTSPARRNVDDNAAIRHIERIEVIGEQTRRNSEEDYSSKKKLRRRRSDRKKRCEESTSEDSETSSSCSRHHRKSGRRRNRKEDPKKRKGKNHEEDSSGESSSERITKTEIINNVDKDDISEEKVIDEVKESVVIQAKELDQEIMTKDLENLPQSVIAITPISLNSTDSKIKNNHEKSQSLADALQVASEPANQLVSSVVSSSNASNEPLPVKEDVDIKDYQPEQSSIDSPRDLLDKANRDDGETCVPNLEESVGAVILSNTSSTSRSEDESVINCKEQETVIISDAEKIIVNEDLGAAAVEEATDVVAGEKGPPLSMSSNDSSSSQAEEPISLSRPVTARRRSIVGMKDDSNLSEGYEPNLEKDVAFYPLPDELNTERRSADGSEGFNGEDNTIVPNVQSRRCSLVFGDPVDLSDEALRYQTGQSISSNLSKTIQNTCHARREAEENEMFVREADVDTAIKHILVDSETLLAGDFTTSPHDNDSRGRSLAGAGVSTLSPSPTRRNTRLCQKVRIPPSPTPVSVTRAVQSTIRKYHLERKIFNQLLELKRVQIRAGRANEQVLVKRLVDDYQKAGRAAGLSLYEGNYSFRQFERFLYEQLHHLQAGRHPTIAKVIPADDLESLSALLVKTRAELGIDDGAPSPEPGLCTRLTHRCRHAAHAYTGIPCAAYITKLNHHTMPKSNKCFLPKINTAHRKKSGKSSERPVTLEVINGREKQVISLPTDYLDRSKRYFVTFTIKGGTPPQSVSPTTVPDSSGHYHAKTV